MLLQSLIFAGLLLGQSADRAYIVTDPDTSEFVLALDDGRYPLTLGYGCDGIGSGMNVVYVAGSRGVGAILPIGTDQVCNVFTAARISETPCATDPDGVCDVALESAE